MTWFTSAGARTAQRRRSEASGARRVIAASVACFCLAVFSAPVQAALIGFAVSDPTPAGLDKAFDIGWIARLQSQGHTVVQLGDNEALPAPYVSDDEFDLFIVSGDVGANNWVSGPVGLNSKAAQIIYENGLLDEIFSKDFSAQVFGAGLAAQTEIEVVNPSHPLAAGFAAGLYEIFAAPADLSRLQAASLTRPWNPDATLIASSSDGGAAIIELVNGVHNPAGVTNPVGTLDPQGPFNKGLKIGIFAKEGGSFDNLTAEGLALLDAAVAHGLANKVPEPTTAALLLSGVIAAGIWRRKTA